METITTKPITCSRRTFVAATAALTAAVALGGCTSDTEDEGSAADDEDADEAEETETDADAPLTSTTAEPTGALAIDMAAWNYDESNDVWWQVGVAYCEEPQMEAYETMGLYVPGAYLTGEANDDGTYTCTRNDEGTVGDFTALTAPVVIPVNTAGYAAQAAPTSYSYTSVSSYLEEGLIYCYPGCRGRDNGSTDDGSLAYGGGAPWGVTDLKSAVRCLRYNSAVLPGDMASVFTFGHSGGGAQSSLVGATGNSALYEPYLEEIGAALTDSEGNALSDATAGAMCWCPITCLTQADEAYEWQMGQFASTGTRAEGTFTAQLSLDLAATFAEQVNALGLTKDGEALTLEESDEGVYLSGTYADVVLATIEESLNNFLEDTEFPYTPSSSSEMADGGFGGGLTGGTDVDVSGDLPDGDVDLSELGDLSDLDSSELPSGDIDVDSSELPDGDVEIDADADADLTTLEETDEEVSGTTSSTVSSETVLEDVVDGDVDTLGTDEGIAAISEDADTTTDDSSSSSTSYETAADYVESLNADEEWVSYDEETGTATVASLGAFARQVKSPTKDVCAFDDLSRGQAENGVFNDGESSGLHFDRALTDLLAANEETYAELENWDETYPTEYEADLAKLDSVGLTVEERTHLYDPLYYLLESSEGFGTSTPAPHWRIRTGITQGDTAVTTELNLALALEAHEDVEDVDFATVWGQGHTTAERTGDSDTNFIAWVKECVL